jgi:hypothetical protein
MGRTEGNHGNADEIAARINDLSAGNPLFSQKHSGLQQIHLDPDHIHCWAMISTVASELPCIARKSS